MAYWWERYTDTPDSNITSPPDGAPENHFPDQVNNIQRQAMAAISEIGDKVLGTGDGSPAPQAATTINDTFLKLVYDSLLPVNTVMAWNSKGDRDVNPFPVPEGNAFAAVVWVPCDGIAGVPDFANRVIEGAQFATGAGESFTGDDKASVDTGEQPLQVLNASSGPVRLTLEQTPPHNHPVNDPTHAHAGFTTATLGQSAGGSPGSSSGVNQITGSVTVQNAATGISILNTGGEGPGFTQAAEHLHSVSVDDVDAHSHTAGRPETTALELYVRTA